jgi:hypothetical protein
MKSSRTILLSAIGNTELLDMYGYEPVGEGKSIRERREELACNWSKECSEELGGLRQAMLQIHLDLCPEDESWVRR